MATVCGNGVNFPTVTSVLQAANVFSAAAQYLCPASNISLDGRCRPINSPRNLQNPSPSGWNYVSGSLANNDDLIAITIKGEGPHGGSSHLQLSFSYDLF